MTLPCFHCSTYKESSPPRPHSGPYQDRATGEWIARCTHCGAGQVVEAPAPVDEHPKPPPNPEPVEQPWLDAGKIIDEDLPPKPIIGAEGDLGMGVEKLTEYEQALEDQSKVVVPNAPIVQVPHDAHMQQVEAEVLGVGEAFTADGVSLGPVTLERHPATPEQPAPTQEDVDSAIAQLEATE